VTGNNNPGDGLLYLLDVAGKGLAQTVAEQNRRLADLSAENAALHKALLSEQPRRDSPSED